MKTKLLSSIFMGVMLMTSGICKADVVDEIKGDYKGSITVDLGDGAGDPILDQKVTISSEEDVTKIRFTLYNFNFAPVIVNENIVLDNVPVTKAVDGTVTIGDEAYAKDLTLGVGGVVQAVVKFDSENSYIDGNDIMVDLNIVWEGITIKVRFAGVKDASGIIANSADFVSRIVFDATTGTLTSTNLQDSNYQVYSITGEMVKTGRFENGFASVAELSGGLYVVKAGSVVTKIVKK